MRTHPPRPAPASDQWDLRGLTGLPVPLRAGGKNNGRAKDSAGADLALAVKGWGNRCSPSVGLGCGGSRARLWRHWRRAQAAGGVGAGFGVLASVCPPVSWSGGTSVIPWQSLLPW